MSALEGGVSRLPLGAFTVQGVSLGGLYTALHIPELSALLDVGLPLRCAVGAKRLFLSHAHLDHIGGLSSFLAMRGMMTPHPPIELYCPAGLEEGIRAHLEPLAALHGWPLVCEAHPLSPGDEVQLDQRRWVRALKTFHPVPSLGYLFYERVEKLKAEFRGAPGQELARLRKSGAPITESRERPLVAYLTDTLPEVLDHHPEVREASLLIIECTFLDDRKPVSVARAGCHIHIDELIERLPEVKSDRILLMHFSQLTPPRQVREICERRLRPLLGDRLALFLPEGERWWL